MKSFVPKPEYKLENFDLRIKCRLINYCIEKKLKENPWKKSEKVVDFEEMLLI